MRRFYIGQKVVCVFKTPSKIITTVRNDGVSVSAPAPQFNEVVTVESYSHIHPGAITFFEYPYIPPVDDFPVCFSQHHFEPLAEISELTAILESEPIENLKIL